MRERESGFLLKTLVALGFLSVLSVHAGSEPGTGGDCLKIAFSPALNGLVTNLSLTWKCNGTLESATNVAGPFYGIPGATSPYVITPAAPQRYYRLRQSGSAPFLELPADLPLPATPMRGTNWTRNAIVVQPWGYTQLEMMDPNAGTKPSFLKATYGFNTICIMPPAALAAVGGGAESETDLFNALAAYKLAGYKIILYSSLVNMGHDPSWYAILQQHPEWRQIDVDGKTSDWLCPNNDGVLDRAIVYTSWFLRRYAADGVMLDNNAFMDVGSGKPACYCNGCRAKFKTYVLARFGGLAENYFGVAAQNIDIPRSPGPLYNLWKYWRTRSWVETMEQVRLALTNTVILANTQYAYWSSGANGWLLAHDRLYSHEDMVLSESYFMEPRAVSSKMKLGMALAQSRPLFDLVGTFQWNPPDFSPLKPADLISRLTAASLMHGANPWLGYYAMEGDDGANTASRQALSRYLLFRSRHPEFYTGTRLASSVGSILPLASYTYLGTSHPVMPPHVSVLAQTGVASEGICDLNLNLEDLSRYKILVAEGAACLDPSAAGSLAAWVRDGGSLVTISDLSTRDEIGRLRPRSKVAEELGLNTLATGAVGTGAVYVVSHSSISNKVMQLVGIPIRILDANPQDIEVKPMFGANGGLLLHIINFGPVMTRGWRIQLPANLTSGLVSALLYRPGNATASVVSFDGQEIQLPPIDAYAVVQLNRT